MPTLIRLVITLLFLVGLAYAGMFALVATVKPEPRETTIRIPTTELLGERAPGLPGQAPAPAVPAASSTPAAPAEEPATAAAPAPAPASP
ncbi:MAG: hypothetical protein JWR39_2144 [Devosia sp.]|jgi:hypothetical protein|nr:hypothetical protein [Devosia sp.]